jgi:amino acid permease
MDLCLKIAGLAAILVFVVLSIWGFALFCRLNDDIRKQNMILFSILEKLTNNKTRE